MREVGIKAGLRIDVDTLRGTRRGVPNLLKVLSQHQIKATFFFSVGPDNMGRHLLRLLRPTFLIKMLRSKASNLYGWDIIFRGTLWPGPIIGNRCGEVIRQVSDEGHEIGLHAWDHHRWQTKIANMTRDAIRSELQKGKTMLEQIIGTSVLCSAVPGWRCTDTVLQEKENFDFHYNSDCRGSSIFFPEINKSQLAQPQIPVTLPTYDELIGRNGITDKNYNEHLLSLFKKDQLNVLTIHAEAEGISCLEMFDDFLKKARQREINFCPLNELLESDKKFDRAPLIQKAEEGRDGWISYQS